MIRSKRKRPLLCRRRLIAERLEDRRLLAGPHAPAADQSGSTAISKDDPSIVAWATGISDYTAGSNVDPEFQTPDKAIGPAEGTAGDAVSLGRGGAITLTFAEPIRDGLGPDFAVFENGFSDTFLELGFVEVSSDGVNFFRFDSDSLTAAPVDAFGAVDPTDIHNLAGKYRQGFGTPFDLEELAGESPLIDTTSITHVRVADIVGDGSQSDSSGDPIYDPFPTTGSAGLDLDAVGVIFQQESSVDIVGFEDVGATLSIGSAFNGPDPSGTSITGPFDDTVVVGSFQSETLTFNNSHSLDFGSWNQWAYSNANDTTTPGFTNQFSSFAGGGAEGSSTFGIGFPDQSNVFEPPTISRDSSDMRQFKSLMVTNTTYAALSMRDGDAFAKRFGGASGNDPDFLLLTITGKDADDNSIGTVDFYLADYRSNDNSLDYIVDEWTDVDLRSIADARSLEFSVTSSDVGPFGINTPAYFAVDHITLARPVLPIDISHRSVLESAGSNAATARVSRAGSDTSTAITVTLAAVDSTVASIPASVTIPSGQRYVEFPIGAIDNNLVDGDRQITITASADGFVSSSRSLEIQDDDVRGLSLSLGQSDLEEGSSIEATVSRNDSDVTLPLSVQVTSATANLLSLPQTLAIAAGQTSATFTIAALDDAIDRPDTVVDIIVAATGYTDGVSSLEVIDNDLAMVTIELDPSVFSESDALPTTGFEDVGRRLAPESFYNGADQAGGFQSNGLLFNNEFNATFGSWSGWSFSNTTDSTTAGFTNQYSAIAGRGAGKSDTYAVATAFDGALVPTVSRDPETSGDFGSIRITNTTYAALSMMQGDDFAKKFGGESGDDPDFFLLTIEGINDSGASVGVVDFYLADFRFADNRLDYIVDEWTMVDLSSLAGAVELAFALSSSDVGSFGMNTPAYFAVDDVEMANERALPMITVHRNASDTSEDLAVTLASSDPSEAAVPAGLIIPAGASSASAPITIRNDNRVDGDQTVSLEASAPSNLSSTASITVADDDSAELTLTITTPTLGEPDGLGRAVVHRNVADVTEPLVVALSSDPTGDLMLPETTTIPTGQRSVEFAFTPEDNDIVDGDRSVVVTGTADRFSEDGASVLIIDEDVPPPTLTIELDRSSLSESDAPTTILLEDVGARMAAESFRNGSDLAGGFDLGNVHLNNAYDSTFGSWGGWAVSNTTDTVTPGFANQYSSISGGGANHSATYAVASAFPGATIPSISILNPQEGRGV